MHVSTRLPVATVTDVVWVDTYMTAVLVYYAFDPIPFADYPRIQAEMGRPADNEPQSPGRFPDGLTPKDGLPKENWPPVP